MARLEGVYWDLDGTIANTELEAHLPAFNKSFKDLGMNWYWDDKTYIDLLKINGGRNRIRFYGLFKNEKISEDQIIKIHNRKQHHYLNLIEDGAVKLKKGVYRLISELMEKEVRQFIVTSSSRIQVDVLMNILFKDINPFEFFITSEDVKSHKPAPLPYLKAIRLSKINKSNSIVFEDSIPGVTSSLSANLLTICVQSNIPVNFSNEINLDLLIDSLGDDNHPTKIIKGNLIPNKYINYDFLNKFLNQY